jgi:hypothetical protein
MLRAAWNPAGGLRYHVRAWRRRNSAWLAFRTGLSEWLATWEPKASTLAIVGPSGGYCLPMAPLERFERLIIFEPDPIARWILGRRLVRELTRRPSVTWITSDVWVGPLLTGGGCPEALLRRDTAILFSNFVGQLPYLVEAEHWNSWRDAWQRSVWPLLARTPWASFHDRVSGTVAPRLPMLASATRLTDDEVTGLYEPDAAGPPLELLDHCSAELLPEGTAYLYFNWPLTADTYHLIEAVIGGG